MNILQIANIQEFRTPTNSPPPIITLTAIRAASSPEKKLDYIWERSRLYEEQAEYRRALEGYQMILSLLSPTDSEKYFKLAWALSRVSYASYDRSRSHYKQKSRS